MKFLITSSGDVTSAEYFRDLFGQVEEVELIKNGANIPVTLENKQEYVDAYVHYYLNQSIKAQFQAFANVRIV